jgi:hypothetical protein
MIHCDRSNRLKIYLQNQSVCKLIVSEGNLMNIFSNCKSVSELIGKLQSEPIGETLQFGSLNRNQLVRSNWLQTEEDN